MTPVRRKNCCVLLKVSEVAIKSEARRRVRKSRGEQAAVMNTSPKASTIRSFRMKFSDWSIPMRNSSASRFPLPHNEETVGILACSSYSIGIVSFKKIESVPRLVVFTFLRFLRGLLKRRENILLGNQFDIGLTGQRANRKPLTVVVSSRRSVGKNQDSLA